MAAFSEEIVEIKCDPHKILNNTYLYRFFCSKVKSHHNVAGAIIFEEKQNHILYTEILTRKVESLWIISLVLLHKRPFLLKLLLKKITIR